jgi:hypothetical protein
LASADKKLSHGDRCKMLLSDLASVIVGSAILVGLFVSISSGRPKTIIALNNKWQKMEVRV